MVKDFKDSLFTENAVFIEEMYQLYLKQPTSVNLAWQQFFHKFSEDKPSFVKTTTKIFDDSTILKNVELANHPDKKSENISNINNVNINNKNIDQAASLLITHYRKYGHLLAKLDPLNLEIIPSKEKLKFSLENFNLTLSDLSKPTNVNIGLKHTDSLEQLINYLDKIYCSSIGIECDHIENFEEYEWITNVLETQTMNNFSVEEKKWALNSLLKSELFEQFLQTKFPAAKRFSVEGAESSVLALNEIIDFSTKLGAKVITIGMAHRGRLNNLVNVMGKPYREIFSEFLGIPAFGPELDASGDVKYHLGYSTKKTTPNGQVVYLSMTPNPSHLEAVNSVVMGQVRAKQDLDKDKLSYLGILIHGDAAFCGQGVVAENLIMSTISAYNILGIIHIVVNNQIGFTADPIDAHSGRYATSFAKIISAPILHVNGDDIEAVLEVVRIAVDYRFKFKKDIVIDIVCYRKYGHNEGDEPRYTQVNMYKAIDKKDTTATLYSNKLIEEKIIDSQSIENIKQQFKELLNQDLEKAKTLNPTVQTLTDKWEGYKRSKDITIKSLVTGVNKKTLQNLGAKLCNIPSDFALHPKLKTLFNNRSIILEKDQPIDWATAEQLAFATLLNENIPVRLTGQDSERGTFSHRHSVLHDQENGKTYIPLNNLTQSQAKYFVADSNLSEYSVLGFEYGYSLVNPKHLVIWEAQYGDFANGAQILFDQYISSAETKWLRLSGLVTLLPHAYEGQGPEHTSARLERFLQFCAEDNIQVVYPTTPASIFHLLRRQVLSNTRTPLIIMSPKSLLRHKLAVSKLDDISDGTEFIPILDETSDQIKIDKIDKIICCTGKIYYDLFEALDKSKISNIVVVRFEQLYPFNEELMNKILNKYKNLKEFIWCQEEPQNMGAWNFIKDHLNNLLIKNKVTNHPKYIDESDGLDTRSEDSTLMSNSRATSNDVRNVKSFVYVGRKSSASPATGYLYVHNKEQQEIIKQALKD